MMAVVEVSWEDQFGTRHTSSAKLEDTSLRRLPPRKSPGRHRLCHESELISGALLRHRTLLPH
jgi:hypothetical protein